MNANDWIHKALDELTSLLSSRLDDPADSWRAAVLIARIQGSPIGPTLPAEFVAQLPELLQVAGQPDHETLLDLLIDELESDDEPWGRLLDVLLDVDDALGVLVLAKHDDTAHELSARIAALMSLYPSRSIPLVSFAQMRLETTRHDSVIAKLWQTIERAPAQVWAEALPAVIEGKPTEVVLLTLGRPWFEAAYSKLQRAFATFKPAFTELCAYIRPDVPLDFAATLGDSSTVSLELVWGEIQYLEVALNTLVKVRGPSTYQLWYSTSSNSDLLEHGAWMLEQGDSPVLITATESQHATSLDEALKSGCRAASLVIVEANNGTI